MTGETAPSIPRDLIAAESERRVAAMRALLERRGASAALLSIRRNFCWLTGGGEDHVVLSSETGVASILTTSTECVVITSNIEAQRLRTEELVDLPLELVSHDWWDTEALGRELARRGVADWLDDAALEPDLMPLRARLVPFEHERLRWLGGTLDAAMSAALHRLELESPEYVLAGHAVAQLGLLGVRAPVVLVAADERIERYRHPLPTDAPIRRRVMLVLVAERFGLHVAATRFKEVEVPGADLSRRIEAVAEVQQALREATRSGATLGDCFAAAQAAYSRVGFPDEWRLHHQGGLIGYQGRERIAVPGDATVIEPGMAFAWNPSITGTKVEETFLLAEDGSPEIIVG